MGAPIGFEWPSHYQQAIFCLNAVWLKQILIVVLFHLILLLRDFLSIGATGLKPAPGASLRLLCRLSYTPNLLLPYFRVVQSLLK